MSTAGHKLAPRRVRFVADCFAADFPHPFAPEAASLDDDVGSLVVADDVLVLAVADDSAAVRDVADDLFLESPLPVRSDCCCSHPGTNSPRVGLE